MKNCLLVTATVLFVLSAAPACAALLYATNTGRPELLIYEETDGVKEFLKFFLSFLLGIAFLGILSDSSSSSSKETQSEPIDLLPMETPEYFDQEAARMRARARMLDAEATLKESEMRLLREKESSGRRK